MTEKRDGSVRHRVVLGDDLRSLAEHYYDDTDRWRQLWYANRAVLANETSLIPGESLIIPDEAMLSTERPEPGAEPDGMVGPDGFIQPPESSGTLANAAAAPWSTLPRRPNSRRPIRRRSMPPRSVPSAPVIQQPERPSLSSLLGRVPRPIISFALILIMGGGYAIFDAIRQRVDPEKVLDLPGVSYVDGEGHAIGLHPSVTEREARDVLNRAFRLGGEWELILGPVTVMIVHGGHINSADELYPNVDLMVRIAEELPQAPFKSITIDSSYRIVAFAKNRAALIATSRTLAEIVATDGHGMAVNELRVVEEAADRSVTVAEHIGVTEADDVGVLLGSLTRLPDFGVVDLADRYRVVLRSSRESEIGRSCRSADKVFDDLDLRVDLEVTVGTRYGNARPCPR